FVRYQLPLHVFSDHGNRHVVRILLVRKEPPALHGCPAVSVSLFGTAHLYRIQVVSLVPRTVNASGREQIRANMRYRWTTLGNGTGILQRQRLSFALLPSRVSHGRSFGDDDRVRPKTADLVRDGPIQPRNDRADADHGTRTNDHSENRQDRTQLMLAN